MSFLFRKPILIAFSYNIKNNDIYLSLIGNRVHRPPKRVKNRWTQCHLMQFMPVIILCKQKYVHKKIFLVLFSIFSGAAFNFSRKLLFLSKLVSKFRQAFDVFIIIKRVAHLCAWGFLDVAVLKSLLYWGNLQKRIGASSCWVWS